MHSTYAELFYDFWVKVMKLHYPAASEEDFLDVFKRIIENKEEQLKMKRGRSTMDEEEDGDSSVREPIRDGSVDTTPAETPPLAKESLFNRLKQFPARASYKDQLIKLAHVLRTIVEHKSPHTQLSTVLRFYRPILKERHDDYPRRQRDLEHLREAKLPARVQQQE